MVDLMWRDLTFCTGPMVDLMWRDLTFCQCFFSRETRKFMAKCTFWTKSSSDMPTFPTATERHKTFFIWNLMVDFRSSTFCSKLSLWVTKEGNLPALLSPGPRSLGICLIRVSEARNASYFLASFFTFFLSLLSFFRTQEPGDLLDQGVRSEERIVLLSKLLHFLLVLVELLQVVSRHAVHAQGLGLVAVLLVSQQAHLVLLARNMLQLHSSGETLVLLGVVVLQTDLEINSFQKLPLLLLGGSEHGVDTLVERLLGDFTHGGLLVTNSLVEVNQAILAW